MEVISFNVRRRPFSEVKASLDTARAKWDIMGIQELSVNDFKHANSDHHELSDFQLPVVHSVPDGGRCAAIYAQAEWRESVRAVGGTERFVCWAVFGPSDSPPKPSNSGSSSHLTSQREIQVSDSSTLRQKTSETVHPAIKIRIFRFWVWVNNSKTNVGFV